MPYLRNPSHKLGHTISGDVEDPLGTLYLQIKMLTGILLFLKIRPLQVVGSLVVPSYHPRKGRL